MLEDLQAAAIISQAIADGEETYPDELLGRLLGDDSPVKVWREYRGFSIKALAEAIGVGAEAMARIEAGEQEMSVGLLIRLSEALRVDMDDLVS